MADQLNKPSMTFTPKVTIVPLDVDKDGASGAALQLFTYTRGLNIQPGEIAAVQSTTALSERPETYTELQHSAGLVELLRQFEGAPLPKQLPHPSLFRQVSVTDMVAFGRALASVRSERLNALPAEHMDLGAATNLLNIALNSTNGLAVSNALPPIGMLNLERLEMTPDGVQRGALIATIPLAPQEQTSVVQQEWSVTVKEFTSIVTDSNENYSETGVTENTQLTQATTSQVSHNNQFNISSTASGGCGFVSGSATVSFGGQDQKSASASDSRTHALQTTKKASSRVTQSHKTSISISTTTGTSETSTRVLVNPSDTDAMRVDYYSLMRKWHVALYRYGLRMTYDVTVPEPGAAMRQA